MKTLDAIRTRLRGGTIANESMWGLVLEIVSLFGTILSFTFLGRSLGPEGYGGYASIFAISGPVVTLAGSGVTLALLQHIIREREDVAEAARSSLTITLVAGTILTMGGTAVAFAIVDSVPWVATVSILATELLAMPVVFLAGTTVQAVTSFAAAARLKLVAVGARVVVLFVLFATSSLTLVSFGVTMLVVSSVIGIGLLRVVGRRYSFNFIPGAPRWRHIKTNLVYSVAISATGFRSEGDKLVLTANGLIGDMGLYSAAYRIVQFGSLPVNSVLNATHGRFLQHDEGVRRQHLRRAMRYAVVGLGYGVAFMIGINLVAPALPWLLGEDFEGSVTMVAWLSPLVLLRAVGATAVNALMGLGRIVLRTVLIVINAVVAVALFVVLIPRYGWEGAAIATVLGEATAMVTMWIAVVVCQFSDDRKIDADVNSGTPVVTAR